MKASQFTPPLVALVVVGVWNASQMRSISSLEHDGAELRGKISAARASANADGGLPRVGGKSGDKNAIDWKRMPAVISAIQNGGDKAHLRAMLDLQQRLKNMSRDEIIAALDEIEGLEMSAEDRDALVSMILEYLVKLDPQYALSRFVDQIESDSTAVTWQLGQAFEQWMKKDPKGAIAWFDQQIAAGKFESRTLDGRSEMRAQFEADVLEKLMSTDLAAAALRMQRLPEDQRREVLEQLSFTELDPAGQKAYAELVRQLVPGDEREGSFANIADQIVRGEGGYDKVSAFLDAVGANPTERAAAAKQTATTQMEMMAEDGEVSRAEVDRMRAWLDKQAPGQTDSIIGKALAEASQDGGKFDYDAASQLALSYHSDAVLVAFLHNYDAHSNLDVAKELAQFITDPRSREEALKNLDK